MKKYKMVLASASPRRKELLSFSGINFEIDPPNVDENSVISTPRKLSEYLAKKKGIHTIEKRRSRNDDFIVSSDTVVSLDGKIFGKPKNTAEAREFLELLSGQTHQVYTGVFIGNKERSKTFSDKTDVVFEKINKNLLESYLKTGDSLDKAGAYGLQGMAMSFISKINGSYSNVIGFPINLFEKEMSDFFSSTDWRQFFR